MTSFQDFFAFYRVTTDFRR